MEWSYKKDINGRLWLKVFYHYYNEGEEFKDSEILFANSKNKLNLIGNITNRYRINGYFEYAIEYEELNITYYWKQKKNIKDTNKRDNAHSIGYVKMSNSKLLGGVAVSNSVYTLYDGIPSYDENNTLWWFCLGIKKNPNRNYQFPGPIIDAVRM